MKAEENIFYRCTCGKVPKKSWNFCPKCGTNIKGRIVLRNPNGEGVKRNGESRKRIMDKA